jgi:hypothetical protein
MPGGQASGQEWRKNFETVARAAFCGGALLICFYVTFSGNFPESSSKYATGLIGLIFGYYLK